MPARSSQVDLAAALRKRLLYALKDRLPHPGNAGQVKRLLNRAPIALGDQDRIAPLAGDLDRLVIRQGRVDELVEIGASRGGSHGFHAVSVRDNGRKRIWLFLYFCLTFSTFQPKYRHDQPKPY